MLRPGTAQLADEFLLERVASHDEAALETLYRTNADAILRFIYRRVGEQFEDAEEITQDTFVSAVSMARTFRGDCSLYTWLCGIAKLRIVDYYRKRGREKRIPEAMITEFSEGTTEALAAMNRGELSVEDALDRISTRSLVDAMMASLSNDEREVLVLRYVEELSIREISLLVRRSAKGVESLLTRAKRKQREAAIRFFGEA
ncbi:MAG: RNA polymerase sigma factor [Armatimonadetes bacterium]|nr:RNA polymerase sigma factor [Armatimonadota bacterium]